jgi:hypothetical protein
VVTNIGFHPKNKKGKSRSLDGGPTVFYKKMKIFLCLLLKER